MSKRRRLGWLIGISGTIAAGAAILYAWIIHTDDGRQWLLSKFVSSANSAFKGRGTLTVSAIREVGWGNIRLERVAIHDTAGVVVLSANTVDADLDLFGLYDRRVHLRTLTASGVRFDLSKGNTGPWNFAFIIAGDTTKHVGPPGYSDDIRVDALTLRDAVITTVAPWAPYPIFKGAARDSVIAVRDSLHDLLHTPSGLFERRRITLTSVSAHDGIITRPDKRPSSLVIDSLRGAISDPPVTIVAGRGQVHWTTDSLRLDLPLLRLPASSGSAQGRVWWNQPGAVRFDVAIDADAGLSDLQWVWNVLPLTGRGTAHVRMRTLESADDAEYSLTKLDVTSDSSHVAGQIDVVVRPADLILRKVRLAFTPITSALMRRLSYDAVPAAVNGRASGTLVAMTGGPLGAFVIDTLKGTFVDRTIAGAQSAVLARGTFGFGAVPTVRAVTVDSLSIDLRTARALMKSPPAVDGTLAGSMFVASADLKTADVADLALVWTDAAGNVSRVRGAAKFDQRGAVASTEAALTIDPVSMRALARVDTTLQLRSDIRGDITAKGPLDSLVWRAALRADSGSTATFEGTAAIGKNAWRTSANGTLAGFDTRAWIGRTDVPVTAINGSVRVAAAGGIDTAGTVFVRSAQGDVRLRQAEAAERPAVELRAAFALDSLRLHVDSASVQIGGITLDASGALARRAGTSTDTLEVSARADTLELVRRQLTRLAATVAPFDTAAANAMRSFAADTVRGDASVSGYLFGSLDDFDATLALGAREVQSGAIRVGRIFGSLQAKKVLTRADFEGVATADEIDGLVGAVRIASAEFRVQQANPDSGRLVLDASSRNDAHLVVRGSYLRQPSGTVVVADSLRFLYDSVTWQNAAPIRVLSDKNGLRIDSLEVRSTARGLLALRANVPKEGEISGAVRLERFPVGEATSFALATQQFTGLVNGEASVSGSRAAPHITWTLAADSLGARDIYLPPITSDGTYDAKRVVAHAAVVDSLGGRLFAEARIPMDLRLEKVDKRLLSDSVDIDITADSLRLDALRITAPGVTRVRGAVAGLVMIHGTVDRPSATGNMVLSDFSVLARELGIEPYEGRAVLRAVQDSLILESFRVRSGKATDTLSASGALRFARNEPTTIRASIAANNAVLARMRDGTDVVVSGSLDVSGLLKRPDISGSIQVPAATLVIDPLGASTALDLTSSTAREYLSPTELPVLQYANKSLTSLGQFASVNNARVELGNDVWVRTPESTVRLTGGVNLSTVGDALVPEGTITANRGQYLLDLGVVKRGFSVDSGTVRFYGDTALAPALDISATNVVKLSTGDEIPVQVHIGGTVERPVVTLSSRDPLYASAPESEIISLLIFGAPTFALDGQSQNTVKAVAGVLIPSAGGAVEGVLQKLLGVNTVQVTTAGGQTRDALNANPLALVGSLNLSITAGKQIGDRTFLRANAGVCRNAGQSLLRGGFWGLSAEYRLSHGLTGQVGVDPGSAPCSRVGLDVIPRLQFGFDLFREWIF